MNRTDHTGYIQAVTTRLDEEEVRVTATRIGTTEGLRWAELDLEPEDCPRLNEDRREEHYVVSWDEEAGWGICAQMASGRRSEVYEHGLQVAPPVETAALWVLGHTLEFYPPRPDGPFRAREEHTPALEERLAAHTV